ncbi:hypothetical protein H7849_11800 [Alloacidobacterium dinghuense]|uniref:Uncharacterized protein n=1 Tax=Alloacidobacterium dinghuense TaxID=2763107 RepID=A0A7G8BPN9_9BACT|nr:hypothetical protein [Alloacidobacterium dinghuense]QNI34509.1 hypothetical protein H7849_11800 [Alloacidobacterium dinghuense]
MAITTQVTCDVCGQQKKDGESWLVAVRRIDAPGIGFGAEGAMYEGRSQDLAIEHICGQGCAHTRLSRWLDSQLHQTTEAA